MGTCYWFEILFQKELLCVLIEFDEIYGAFNTINHYLSKKERIFLNLSFYKLYVLINLTLQGNARRLLDKRCDGNSRLGQLSKLGLAPILWCIILLLLVTYIHSAIIGIFLEPCMWWNWPFLSILYLYCFVFSMAVASELPGLTAGFGLLAWFGVFLASAGLVMFYKCSKYALCTFFFPSMDSIKYLI